MRASLTGACAVFAFAAGACGYDAAMVRARASLDEDRVDDAMAAIDGALGVRSPDELPARLDGDKALLLLERAALAAEGGRYEASRRDLETADPILDALDITRRKKTVQVAHVAAWIGGGRVPHGLNLPDVVRLCGAASERLDYRARPTERLLANALDAADRLALHDPRGACVEARRHDVFERYARDELRREPDGAYALGEWLGGVAFEESGDAVEAASRYALASALTRVAPRDDIAAPPPGEGDLFVLTWVGRVSARTMTILPAAEAEAEIANEVPPAVLEAARKGPRIVSSSGTAYVRWPRLAPARSPPAAFFLDGALLAPDWELDVAALARGEWDRERAALASACLVCGCADLDLRSWETLPARVGVARRRVTSGEHVVLGGRRPVVAHVPPGGWTLVIAFASR